MLRHEFTEAEERERGLTLAALLEVKNEVLCRKADANKGFREEIEAIDEQIERAGKTIREHGEERATECLVRFHSPSTGRKEIFKAPDGEKVGEEAMTPEECQEHLFESEATA